jgi:hypothetical protein
MHVFKSVGWWDSLFDRQQNFDQQARRIGVLGTDSSAVGLNDAFGDGEAKSAAARLPISVIGHSIKGSKDIDEL